MVNSIHIKGPLGSLSAEMLLPKGFDRENGRCELVILLHGFLGSKKAAPRLTCKLPWGGYPKSLHSLNMKNGRSDTPLS